MVMYFQDDFWEAVTSIESTKDQDAVIVALVRYHFEKDEQPKNPVAKAILSVCKKRIDLSETRSKAGAKRKQKESKTEAKSEQSDCTASHSLSNSISIPKDKTKHKRKTGAIDFSMESEQERYPFSYHCLQLFNDALGRRCRTMQHEVVTYLESLEDRPADQQITNMVKAKNNEWGKDEKTKGWVNQDTLFRARNFLGYIDKTQDYQDDDEWMRPYIEHAERNKVVLTGTPNSDDTPWPFEEVGF